MLLIHDSWNDSLVGAWAKAGLNQTPVGARPATSAAAPPFRTNRRLRSKLESIGFFSTADRRRRPRHVGVSKPHATARGLRRQSLTGRRSRQLRRRMFKRPPKIYAEMRLLGQATGR